jgi:hypothetical protein
VLCYLPTDDGTCQASRFDQLRANGGAESYRVSPAPVEPLYSGPGPCPCSVDGHPAVEGPFAPNPTEALEAGGDPAATCCYVVGSQYCLGRPFVWNGLAHVAPLAARGDWGLFA